MLGTKIQLQKIPLITGSIILIILCKPIHMIITLVTLKLTKNTGNNPIRYKN